MKKFLIGQWLCGTCLILLVACNAQQEATTTTTGETRPEPRGQRDRQGAQRTPPSVDELLKMDADGDGQLSKAEVKGPLANDFAKIDTDGNGLLSRAELEKAPRPQRGQRPPRQ